MNPSQGCFVAILNEGDRDGPLAELRARVGQVIGAFGDEIARLPDQTLRTRSVDELDELISVALASPGRYPSDRETGTIDALAWAQILIIGMKGQ